MFEVLLSTPEISRAVDHYVDRSSSLSHNWVLFLVLFLIAGFWVGLYLLDQHRRQNRNKANSPSALFMELCQAHRLSPQHQQVLWKAAQSRKLAHPALVFMDADVLNHYAQQPEAKSEVSIIEQIHARLFEPSEGL